jgi:O-antigen ligase
MLLPRFMEKWRLTAAIVLPLVAIVVIMWFTIRAFLGGEATYGTLVTRLELWNRALGTISSDVFTDVIGNGYPAYSTTVITFDYPNAHNAWLNHVLSFGFIGLALYLGCYVSALRRACRALVTAEHPARLWLLAATSSLAALLGENFFEPTDRGDIYPTQLFLIVCLATIVPRVFRSPTERHDLPVHDPPEAV